MQPLQILLAFVAINPLASVLAKPSCKAAAVESALSDISLLGEPATEFCYSHLGIPATTTSYVIETPTSILTFTRPVTTTVTDASCPQTLKKRDVAVPTGLSKYGNNILSSACSHLSLEPTATATFTGIASIAATVTSTVEVAAATATLCTGSTCTPVDEPCDFSRPELCCSQACACRSGVCQCFKFL